MQTELCNWGWASCGCGVTVRAGRDVFTISHCHDDHIIESLLNEDGLLEVRRRTSNRYQVNNRSDSVNVGSEEKDVQQISGKQ